MVAPVLDLAASPGGGVVSQAICGDPARLLADAGGGWVEAESGEERGFCRWESLEELPPGAWPVAGRDRFVRSVEALAFAEPTRRAGPPRERLPLGARVRVRSADRGSNGFVPVTVRGASLWIQAEDLTKHPPEARSVAARLAVAASLLGRPYVWGGCSSLGLDCSGLCRLLGRLAGVLLPHSAARQAALETDRFAAVPGGEGAAEPGDFLYLASAAGRVDHVVVAADGGEVLHASAEGGVPSVRREAWGVVRRRGRVEAVRRLLDPGREAVAAGRGSA